MSTKSKHVKLHIHCESDLIRTVIHPSSRKKCPISRPPILTDAQWELWAVLSGEDPARQGYGVEMPTVSTESEVWDMLVVNYTSKPRAYGLTITEFTKGRISITARTNLPN
jgi:hypothetical protein